MSLFSDLATVGGALGFKPTGLYSFEFVPRANPSGRVEMFLLVPPEQYSMQYGYRMTVHKTIGSTVVDWSGVDNPMIQLTGSLWSYWIDQLPAPFGNQLLGTGLAGAVLNNFASGLVNKAATAVAGAISSVFPLNQMSGLDEFFRIKFMLYDFWQREGLMLDEGVEYSDLVPTSLNTLGLLPADGIFGGMSKLKSMGDKNNLYDIQLIYHDYDDNVHWEVVPQNFKVMRSVPDVFTAKWTAELIGIKDVRRQPFFVPVVSKKVSADDIMQNIATTLIAIDPLLVFETAVNTYAADLSELEKLSWSGTLAAYEIALSNYFNGFANNQDQVIAYSDAYADTARQATIQAIQAIVGQDAATYSASSASNTPTLLIIESGYSDTIQALGIFLLYVAALAGMRAYSGIKIPIYNNQSGKTVNDLPTIDENYISGTQSSIINYSTSGWQLYTVKNGNNLGLIAIRQLGDYAAFPEIAQLNNLQLTDFALNGMVGKTIKLPIEKQSVYTSTGNLVYWRYIPNNSTIQSLQDEIIGRDLLLDDNRDMLVDNSGDLENSLPGEGFQQNISDSVSLPQGTLPLYSEWGNPLQVGQVNVDATPQLIKTKIENVITADPRVKSVSTDMTKTKQIGDRIYFESTVIPLVGIQQII